jgi:DNA-binding transcriptional regulator YiaG
MKGKTLRKIRRDLKLTQEGLAKALGVAGNTVARWERDELPIREPIARLIKSIQAAGVKTR